MQYMPKIDISENDERNVYYTYMYTVTENENLMTIVSATDLVGNTTSGALMGFTIPSQPNIQSDQISVNSNDTLINIYGEAESGTTITLYPDGVQTTQSDSSGEYSFTTSISNTTQFYVTAMDIFGNESVQSESITVTFDNTIPYIDLTTDKSIVKQGDTITITAVFSEAVNNVTINK